MEFASLVVKSFLWDFRNSANVYVKTSPYTDEFDVIIVQSRTILMLVEEGTAKMDDDMLMNMELGHVMDLLSQCLTPMEQLQCYLASQQGFFYQVVTLS